MTAVMTVAALVPLLVAAVWVAASGRALRFVEDRRGIALQTVIIIVVLIAIAGGVATVLITRGGDAVNEIDRTEIGVKVTMYTNEAMCEAAGKKWSHATTHCWE